MSLPRRSLLVGGGAVLSALAGCTDLGSGGSHEMDLVFVNYTSEVRRLRIELLRHDGEEYRDALAYDEEVEIPSEDEDSAGLVRKYDVVPRRRYLVRVLLWGGRGQWHHYHFFPGESTTEPEQERLFIRVYRDDEADELYVRFT
ncbi:hypothetical protein [Halalkaliarchaeum desulfuricum]|nr:hypothetical protein [Halalkaliarchaeum desulfuricum]